MENIKIMGYDIIWSELTMCHQDPTWEITHASYDLTGFNWGKRAAAGNRTPVS